MGFYHLLILFALLTSTTAASNSSSTKSLVCPIKLPQDNPFRLRQGVKDTKPIPEPAQNSSSDPRIVNGDLISGNLIPYMVVTVPFSCTGVLISPTWFLTAAHCELDSRFQVALGLARAGVYNSSNVRQIRRSAPHPKFNDPADSGQYDFAAYQLSEPAPPGTKFMKVNVNPELPQSHTFCRVAGYGDIETGISGAGFGRQVDVPVTSARYCKSIYNVNPSSQFCAGYMKGGCDSCQGDSGGPIFQYDISDEPVLVGLVSSGAGCADVGRPGVYVRTAAFESYLDGLGADYTKANEIIAIPVNRAQSLGVGFAVGITIVGFLCAVGLVMLTCLCWSRGCCGRRRDRTLPLPALLLRRKRNTAPMEQPPRTRKVESSASRSDAPNIPLSTETNTAETIPQAGAVSESPQNDTVASVTNMLEITSETRLSRPA